MHAFEPAVFRNHSQTWPKKMMFILSLQKFRWSLSLCLFHQNRQLASRFFAVFRESSALNIPSMPLPKPQPPEVWQTMHTAFKELEGTITTDDSKDFSDSTLSRVREEALAIENRLAARRSLRNMRRLMPLFTALEHYSKAIDVLCNGTPYMPWIWAPITLILRVASEYVDAFEQLIKGYGRIATSLQRFELLGHAFSDDTQFQQTLAIFYADILQFHKHAYTFVRRNGQCSMQTHCMIIRIYGL